MDSLVSTEWLAGHLGDAELCIFDASFHLPATGRSASAEFEAAHIPGARFLDLASFKDAASPVPNALPTGEQMSRRLSELGWTPGMWTVIYDDSDVKTSARAWFALRRAGIASAILDGGFGKWKAEGRPCERGTMRSAAGAPAELTIDDRKVRNKRQILANVATQREQVIDARDGDRFTGVSVDTVHDLPGGHIPGSRNLFFRDLYRADGTFKPTAGLRAAFDEAGVNLTAPIVTTCGSGVTASILLFALHLLGIEDAALYDGSWSEWGADPATPKATGPA